MPPTTHRGDQCATGRRYGIDRRHSRRRRRAYQCGRPDGCQILADDFDGGGMIPLPSTIVLDDPLDVLVEEPNFLEPSRHDIGRSADSILCRFSGHPGLLQTAAASFLNAIGRDIADPEM